MKAFIVALPKTDKNTPPQKAVRFTYVISKDSCMYFSITSQKLAQDFLSKHALHDKATKSGVLCLGNFSLTTKVSAVKVLDYQR
jgi:hypothetical protein